MIVSFGFNWLFFQTVLAACNRSIYLTLPVVNVKNSFVSYFSYDLVGKRVQVVCVFHVPN